MERSKHIAQLTVTRRNRKTVGLLLLYLILNEIMSVKSPL